MCQDKLCNQKSECINSWKPNDLSIVIYFTYLFFFKYYNYNHLSRFYNAMQYSSSSPENNTGTDLNL